MSEFNEKLKKVLDSEIYEKGFLEFIANGISSPKKDVVITSTAEQFVQVFREVLKVGIPWSRRTDTISNWTYHVALSMQKTATIMGVECLFEVEGKRDGLITSLNGEEKYLFAEWESNCNDVFGNGKEIDKLAQSTAGAEIADGLLFTYVAYERYNEYLKRVYDAWISHKEVLSETTLFLTTYNYTNWGQKENYIPARIRTVSMNKYEFRVWTDVDIESYMADKFEKLIQEIDDLDK